MHITNISLWFYWARQNVWFIIIQKPVFSIYFQEERSVENNSNLQCSICQAQSQITNEEVIPAGLNPIGDIQNVFLALLTKFLAWVLFQNTTKTNVTACSGSLTARNLQFNLVQLFDTELWSWRSTDNYSVDRRSRVSFSLIDVNRYTCR